MLTNTDGIALELLTDDAEDIIDEVAHGWEKDWKFILEKTVANNLIQKDVNNYIFRDDDGKIKVKGAYVTKFAEGNEQDTLAILAKAVVNYFLDGVDIRTTICNPENLATDYQMIKKLGSMYDTPTWKREYGDEIVQKVNRIFPSTDSKNGGLYKHKKSKEVGVLDKVEGTPEHVLIYNQDIRGKKIGELDNIDYEWYVTEAQHRIEDFIRYKKNKKERGINMDFEINVNVDDNCVEEFKAFIEEFSRRTPTKEMYKRKLKLFEELSEAASESKKLIEKVIDTTETVEELEKILDTQIAINQVLKEILSRREDRW